jgi:hypothetical protein
MKQINTIMKLITKTNNMKQVYVSNNLGDPLEYDYDLKYEDGKTICLYSNNSEWADFLHGQEAGSIKEIEDGFLVKVGEQKIKLDYAEMQVLKILLLSDLNDADYFEIRESITIKAWPRDIETGESLR